jgi:hypothetical protein
MAICHLSSDRTTDGAVDMRSREQERRVRVRVLLAERSKESPRA